MEEPRFWVDTPVTDTDQLGIEGWVAVIDEERGGAIAYFGREEDAEEYVAHRMLKEGPYKSMHTIGGVIQALLRYDLNTPCTQIMWLPDDVRTLANVTDEEAEAVLYGMEAGKDCGLGQSWDTLQVYLDEVLDQRCGQVLFMDGVPVARCVQPAGVEHDHLNLTATEAVVAGLAVPVGGPDDEGYHCPECYAGDAKLSQSMDDPQVDGTYPWYCLECGWRGREASLIEVDGTS